MKKIFLFAIILSLFFLIAACDDNPSEAGSSVIPVTDAITYKTLETDSIPFTFEIVQKSVVKSGLEYFILGKHADAEAVGIMKFSSFPDSLANATVISADIVIFPAGYSLGVKSSFGVSVHRITSNWSVSSPGNTWIQGPIFNKNSEGSFSGAIVDTEAVYIPLSTSLVKDWFYYASDFSKALLNQGIVIIANNNSDCAYTFWSKDNQTYTDNSKDPYLRVIKEMNGKRDTMIIAPDEDSYYGFTRDQNITNNQNFVMQSGVSYRTKLSFDLSRIPKHAHISNATLTLTMNTNESIIGNNSTDSLGASTVQTNADGTKSEYNLIGYPTVENGNKVYVLNFSLYLQGWLNRWNNVSMDVFHLGELFSLDKLVFYSNTNPDISKRPKIKVTYLTLPN